MLTHPDDLVALARSRHEEALSRAAQRRLMRLAGTAPGAAQTPGRAWWLPCPACGARWSAWGPLVRRAALVPLLVAAATVLSGLLTAA